MAEARTTLPGLRTLMRRGMSSRHDRGAENARAREIQQRLVPQVVPEMQGFRIGCAWQGSSEVSGDYFDVFPLEGRRMALCISDVSGKGMEAAVLAGQVQEAVRRFVPGAGVTCGTMHEGESAAERNGCAGEVYYVALCSPRWERPGAIRKCGPLPAGIAASRRGC